MAAQLISGRLEVVRRMTSAGRLQERATGSGASRVLRDSLMRSTSGKMSLTRTCGAGQREGE